MFTKADFKIIKSVTGWGVERSDGASIAIGFASKADAQAWWDKESTIVFGEAA